jgi:HEAT repeat protein
MIAELKHSDDFARAGILEKLASSPSKELVERLVLLLDDKKTAIRMDVLDTLRRIGNCNIKAVIGLLYSEHEDIRVYGCEVLQGLKNPLSLPHLVEAAREENENVKNAAVVALGEFDDPMAVGVLLGVLEQEEWAAFSAVYSLARIGNRRAAPALMDVFKNRGEELSLAACEALMSFGDDRIVDEIVEFIGSLEADKKRTFVRIIMEHGDGRIFGRLTRLMGETLLQQLLDYIKQEKRKSLKIIDLLAYFKCPDSALALLDMLKDMEPDADEYSHILDLFTGLREVWVPDIAKYLSVEEYRLPVIRACGAAGCHVDDRLLLDVFRSSPLAAKREIMKQLGRIANGNGNHIIREAMRDADGHIQADAVAIAGSLPMRELTPDVLRIAKSGYADVRARALIALIRLDREAAVSTIEAFVTRGSAEDKRIYLAVTPHLDGGTNFPFLKTLIMDGDERVRQMAVRVVGNFVEDEKYLGLFRTMLESGDVPDEMLKVIGEKKLTGFKDVLVRILGDPLQALWTRYHALAALAVFRDPSLFPMFVGCLKDKNNLIKIGSLKALSAIGDKRAVPRIRPFGKSMDEDVKAAAMIALERLSRPGELC